MDFESLMLGYLTRRVRGVPIPEWMQDAIDRYFQLIQQPGMKIRTAQRIVEAYID